MKSIGIRLKTVISKTNVLKLFSICYLFFYGTNNLSAQDFTHRAQIVPVTQNGLYRLALLPEIKQYSTENLSDIRIHDSLNHEVPYVLLSEPQLRSSSSFVEYKIVSQRHLKKHSELIIENPQQEAINNIAFNIDNSDAHKYCSVEGSNDKNQWYSVSALQELSLVYNNEYTNSYKCIYFPKVNYRYVRLLVENYLSEPLKINSAGWFKNSVIPGQLSNVEFTLKQTQVPSQKVSRLELNFNGTQTINRIDFSISEPQLFLRQAKVYIKHERTVKKKTEVYEETLAQIELNSSKDLSLNLNGIKAKQLFIDIYNQDNQPLKIDSLRCYQLTSWLICELKTNKKYFLKCGNSKLQKPDYDLINFIGNAPHLLPQTTLLATEHLATKKSGQSLKTKTFYEEPYFIWICIGVAVIIIFAFSLSLLKDMHKNNQG